MLNTKRTHDIKHGLTIKVPNDGDVGIYQGSSIPSAVDDGTVQQGSLYIRQNGELWQKKGTLATTWVLNSDVAGSGVAGLNQYTYTFNRSGDVEPQTWLKIGKVSSDDATITAFVDITQVMISATTEELSSGEMHLYVKKAGVWTNGYASLVFNNQRALSSGLITLPTPILANEEIAVKCDVGNFEDMVFSLRLIE